MDYASLDEVVDLASPEEVRRVLLESYFAGLGEDYSAVILVHSDLKEQVFWWVEITC